MTAPIMVSRDKRLVSESIEAQNRQALTRLYDEVIAARVKLGWHLKLLDADIEAHCRFWDCLLIDTMASINRGVIIGHPTPRVVPKLPVFLSQLYHERFDSCSEKMFVELSADFREYVKGGMVR